MLGRQIHDLCKEQIGHRLISTPDWFLLYVEESNTASSSGNPQPEEHQVGLQPGAD